MDGFDVKQILNGGPEPDWYTVPNTNVRIAIRAVKPKDRDRFVRQCTTKRMRRGQQVEEVDIPRLNNLLLDDSVVKWENVENGGELFPCTAENRRALNDNWPAFNKLWLGVIREHSDLDEAFVEEEMGNS